MQEDNQRPVEMKMKFYYELKTETGECNCIAVLENGFICFQEQAKSPNVAADVLWFDRPDHKAIFDKMGVRIIPVIPAEPLPEEDSREYTTTFPLEAMRIEFAATVEEIKAGPKTESPLP